MDPNIQTQPVPPVSEQTPQQASFAPSLQNNQTPKQQPNQAKPILFRIIYWLALLEGSLFIFNVIFFTLIKITPPFTPIILLEHFLFGITAIVIFFGLRNNKIWGLYSAIFMVLADLFTIVTNIDGASRDQGSFIILSIEILLTLYLIYRFKNPNAANKWF